MAGRGGGGVSPSIPSFDFLTAGSIQFGTGKLASVPDLLVSFAVSKVLVINDGRPGADAVLTDILDDAGLPYCAISVLKEPSTESVEAGVELALAEGCDGVVSIGGGSVIDSGKAIAAIATNGGKPIDYMEVIGAGKSMTVPALPYIAIPTTSGTGAEVSKNAVVASMEHQVKVSLRSEFMLPRVALVDPELTVGCPPAITATCGLDALCHCLETYCTHLNTPLTDGIAREGILRAAKSLYTTYTNGDDVSARTDMAIVSLFGGITLANAKLGSVHGFAGPLGGMFDAPHGAVVAACMPAAIAINVKALREREPEHDSLKRYTEVAVMLTGNGSASAEDGARWLAEMNAKMNVPGLSHWGVSKADAAPSSDLVNKSQISSSMQGNPIKLTDEEAGRLVELSLPAASETTKL